MNELIDTTEMYLKTIYELEEEGVVPLRARLAERLGQSGPTVSQTVGRMERDGLVVVAGDRHLELTEHGRALAVTVMRKHRLAERLLVDVIGLEWEHVHSEACRWEHVMSEAVERKLVKLLGNPTTSPYGNPIPGLDKLGEGEPAPPVEADLVRMDDVARRGGGKVEVRRIAEHVQLDPAQITRRLDQPRPRRQRINNMSSATPTRAGERIRLLRTRRHLPPSGTSLEQPEP